MKVLKFMGYSDDTFGEYGYSNIDHDNCASGKPITFEVKAGGKTIYVTGQYSRFGNGCWGIEVAPAEEDNLPDWQMELKFKGYTAVLNVYVPHDEIEINYIKR